MGIGRAKDLIARADLVLVILDGSKKPTALDQQILKLSEGHNRLIVKNKSDLPQKCAISGLSVSSKKRDLDQLFQALAKSFRDSVATDDEQALLTERQIGLMISVKESLHEAVKALQAGATVDLAAQFLAGALEGAKAILGEQANDDFLDELFARFCLGK